MALELKTTVKSCIGNYWKILSSSEDMDNNQTIVRVYLFGSKDHRDTLSCGELAENAIDHKCCPIDGTSYTTAELYEKIKEDRVTTTGKGKEITEESFFKDAVPC
jgi:hypothetical protein